MYCIRERKLTENAEPSGYVQPISYDEYIYDEDSDELLPVEDTAKYGPPYFECTCASCGLKKRRFLRKEEESLVNLQDESEEELKKGTYNPLDKQVKKFKKDDNEK